MIPDVLEIANCGASTPGESQLIPRRILQTFESRLVPQGMHDASLSWIRKNPDYDYEFFDDESRRELLKNNFDPRVLTAYDQLQTGAFKADLWRYCALFLGGGVYTDIDTVCLSSLRSVVGSLDTFISVNAFAPRQALSNGFIAITAGHPFMDAAINRAVNNILTNTYRHPKAITGPTCFGEAVNVVLGREVNAPFEDGRQTINGFTIRLLTKIHTADPADRKVVLGPETFFLCKYQGYETDLKAVGTEHWRSTVIRGKRSRPLRWLSAARRRYRRLRGKPQSR